MELTKENIIRIDLDKGTIRRSYACHMLGEGDALGDVFGFEVLKGGEEFDLSGLSVIGYFNRPDGTTVIISGGKRGNVGYVRLPEACYVYEGAFSLTIKLVDGENTATARVVDGTVIKTQNGTIIDPGGVIPDISELTALADRAEAAADAIMEFSIEAVQISGTRYKIIVTEGS